MAAGPLKGCECWIEIGPTEIVLSEIWAKMQLAYMRFCHGMVHGKIGPTEIGQSEILAKVVVGSN